MTFTVRYRVRSRKHTVSEECRDLTEAAKIMRMVNNSVDHEALEITGTKVYFAANKSFYHDRGGKLAEQVK